MFLHLIFKELLIIADKSDMDKLVAENKLDMDSKSDMDKSDDLDWPSSS
jgi:hypothetical protein